MPMHDPAPSSASSSAKQHRAKATNAHKQTAAHMIKARAHRVPAPPQQYGSHAAPAMLDSVASSPADERFDEQLDPTLAMLDSIAPNPADEPFQEQLPSKIRVSGNARGDWQTSIPAQFHARRPLSGSLRRPARPDDAHVVTPSPPHQPGPLPAPLRRADHLVRKTRNACIGPPQGTPPAYSSLDNHAHFLQPAFFNIVFTKFLSLVLLYCPRPGRLPLESHRSRPSSYRGVVEGFPRGVPTQCRPLVLVPKVSPPVVLDFELRPHQRFVPTVLVTLTTHFGWTVLRSRNKETICNNALQLPSVNPRLARLVTTPTTSILSLAMLELDIVLLAEIVPSSANEFTALGVVKY
ncbi:hypothetical protein AURDEDRAFT_172663 [Auricularia subglabra TFB-10046 SS5]|nr:hypothetical protein AURDEDRAFT_172663 [Auricularia subglabra TFB-10046 SS5]